MKPAESGVTPSVERAPIEVWEVRFATLSAGRLPCWVWRDLHRDGLLAEACVEGVREPIPRSVAMLLRQASFADRLPVDPLSRDTVRLIDAQSSIPTDWATGAP